MATVAAWGKQAPHHTSPCTAIPYIPVSSYHDEDEGLDFGSYILWVFVKIMTMNGMMSTARTATDLLVRKVSLRRLPLFLMEWYNPRVNV